MDFLRDIFKPKPQSVGIKDGRAYVRNAYSDIVISSFEYKEARENAASLALYLAALNSLNFEEANFKESIFRIDELKGLLVSKADFSNSHFNLCKYRDSNFKESIFKGSNFSLTQFINSNMSSADFSNIIIEKDMDISHLEPALKFENCDMDKAIFSVDVFSANNRYPQIIFENCKNLNKAIIIDKEGKALPKATLTEKGITYSSKHPNPSVQKIITEENAAKTKNRRNKLHTKFRPQK